MVFTTVQKNVFLLSAVKRFLKSKNPKQKENIFRNILKPIEVIKI